MKLDAFALTITGRRNNNEDAISARPDLGLYVVADGMGGYEGGEVASAIAVDSITELVRRTAGDADCTWPYAIDPQRSPTENELLVATRLANDRIAARRVGELRDMGSTVVALRIAGDRAIVAHVGDSRLYRLRAGVVAQLEASGMPVAADFQWRHVVTRALGTQLGEPDVQCVPLAAGDVFLLCTDGLSEVLAPDAIATLLAQPAEAACRALVDAAYAAGSRDNISAIVVRVI
jgi:serine/threonine protein phosphatase PrpC